MFAGCGVCGFAQVRIGRAQFARIGQRRIDLCLDIVGGRFEHDEGGLRRRHVVAPRQCGKLIRIGFGGNDAKAVTRPQCAGAGERHADRGAQVEAARRCLALDPDQHDAIRRDRADDVEVASVRCERRGFDGFALPVRDGEDGGIRLVEQAKNGFGVGLGEHLHGAARALGKVAKPGIVALRA